VALGAEGVRRAPGVEGRSSSRFSARRSARPRARPENGAGFT